MTATLIEPTFVSLTTAARRLGVPAAWLKAEAYERRVPSMRCGRQLKFDVNAVAESLRNRMTEAVEA